jgi:hypothetical protein
MGLRAQAALDARTILEDSDGFACSITVTDPDCSSAVLDGFAQDIGQDIDPNTGLMVAGRKTTVTLPLAALADAGLGVPKGIAEASSLPWLMTFSDVLGTQRIFKVAVAMPDYEIGIVVCELEGFEE